MASSAHASMQFYPANGLLPSPLQTLLDFGDNARLTVLLDVTILALVPISAALWIGLR